MTPLKMCTGEFLFDLTVLLYCASVPQFLTVERPNRPYPVTSDLGRGKASVLQHRGSDVGQVQFGSSLFLRGCCMKLESMSL